MKRIPLTLIMALIANFTHAGVLLDNVKSSKYYSNWKSIKFDSYQLHISHSGSGSVLLNKKIAFPIVPAMIYNVYIYGSDHKKTGKAKFKFAGKSWEKISGKLIAGENETKLVNVTAISEIGIKNSVSVKATPSFIISKGIVKAVDAPEAFAYRYETAILNYFKLASIPFTATTEEGVIVSGDLSRQFKTIKNIKILELSVKGKKFKIEFEGLNIALKSRPETPTAPAVFSMFPKKLRISSPLMPGSSFSYKIILKILHDDNHE
jgi:hypothetical protein